MSFRRILVYCSKDQADWEAAKELLEDAGVSSKAWESEESPVGGCGSKIDIRSFGTKKVVPKTLYKIEVEPGDEARAKELLAGKVQPVRFYGTGI